MLLCTQRSLLDLGQTGNNPAFIMYNASDAISQCSLTPHPISPSSFLRQWTEGGYQRQSCVGELYPSRWLGSGHVLPPFFPNFPMSVSITCRAKLAVIIPPNSWGDGQGVSQKAIPMHNPQNQKGVKEGLKEKAGLFRWAALARR